MDIHRYHADDLQTILPNPFENHRILAAIHRKTIAF